MKLFLLLTLATIVKADVACPAECECVQGMSQIKCDGRNITDDQLLTMKFPAYLSLNLNDNKLTKLPSVEFWGQNRSFYSLSLAGNRLTSVPQLPRAEIVELSRNEISGELTASNFSSWCNTTANLALDHNRITGIQRHAFSSCSSLSRLTIGHNKIGNNLRRESFNSSGSHLTYLLLSDNGIENLPVDVFDETTYLERLLLDNNNLTYIPVNLFNKLPMDMLFLSNNRIHKIENRVFGKPLKKVYLDHNNLEIIDVDWFAMPSAGAKGTVYLNDNPLQCSCELAANATHFASFRKMVGNCAGLTQDQSRLLEELKNATENCTKCTFVTCQNEAKCNVKNDDSFSCNCTEYFKGQFCEITKTACDSKPCLNNGQCNVLKDNASLPDAFSCECVRGYKGKTCQDLDQCYKDGKYVCDNNKGNSGGNVKPTSIVFVIFLFVFSQFFNMNQH